MKSLRALAALLLCGSSVAVLRAAEPEITVGAALGGSSQAAGDSDRPYLGPGLGGTSVASVIFVDARVIPAIGIGGEVSLAGDISGTQQERALGGSNDLVSRHHDTVFSGVVKFKAPPAGPFQIVAVAGTGVAWRQTNRAGTFRSYLPPFISTPVAETLSNIVFAASGGLDGAIALHQRLAILALVRVHLLGDKDRLPDGVVRSGVSSVIVRYGVGAQVRF